MTEVDEIKSKIDIVSFVGNYVALKKSGRNFTGLCPFHNEKSPSFIVSPERQIWHCFGACSEGGDVITFFMKVENIDFPQALEDLAKQTGVKLSSSYKVTPDQRLKEDIYKANNLASKYYHYLLTSHKLGEKARGYLKSRNTSDKVIETFVLGYAPEAWDSLYKYLTKKGFSEFILQKAGLILKGRSGKYFDRFRGRLIFTLKNHRGDVVGFSGRVMPSSKLKDREAKYINTSETPVYIKGNTLYGLDITKEAIRKENKAVVVEGEFDMLSSFQAGIPYVVAIKGTALTENQSRLLKRFCETIIFALDQDVAGNEAAKRGIDIVEKEGFAIKVVRNTTGKDPDEAIKENPLEWKKAVLSSISVYDFLIEESAKKYNRNDAYGKRKIADYVLPFLERISNTIVQAHYLDLLSGTINIPEEQLREEMATLSRKQALPKVAEINNSKTKLNKEEFLVALLLQNDSKQLISLLIDQEKINEISKVCTNPAVSRILLEFWKYLGSISDDSYQSSKFISTLNFELIPLADKAYLYDLGSITKDKEVYTKVLKNIIKDIFISYYRRTLEEYSTKLAQEEDESKKDELNSQFNLIRNRLKRLDSANVT